MKIYKKNELRDIIIASMVLASFLAIAVKCKSTSRKDSVRTQESFEKITLYQQQRINS